MKLFFNKNQIYFIIIFSFISFIQTTSPSLNQQSKRLFPLSTEKSVDPLKKNEIMMASTEKIYQNSTISLSFNNSPDYSTEFHQNLTSPAESNKTTSNFSDFNVTFQPMRYKSPQSQTYMVINPNENLINPTNNEQLSNNDSYFQGYYSNYFRKYYENLQNIYTPSRNEASQGSILYNPNINHFYNPTPINQQRRDLLNPYATISPYQKVFRPENGNNRCPCQDKKIAVYCDCDEIDNRVLEMPPIVMPIIQPVIQQVPIYEEPCREEYDECSCENDDHNFLKKRRNRCKCGCDRNNDNFHRRYENYDNYENYGKYNNYENKEKLNEIDKNDNQSENKQNVNNANANNANILAQKNTLNKIDTVVATNYSTTNFNHHIHNYIQGADFKFNENNSSYLKNTSFLQKTLIINNFKQNGEKYKQGDQDFKILSRIPKEVIKKMISENQINEMETDIKEEKIISD